MKSYTIKNLENLKFVAFKKGVQILGIELLIILCVIFVVITMVLWFSRGLVNRVRMTMVMMFFLIYFIFKELLIILLLN